MSVSKEARNYKDQEHNHMHAFGATLFMITLVGLIALSYIWQTKQSDSTGQDSILAASAVSVIAPDESAGLYQPEDEGALLEGDSLNGFRSDYVGYVNQSYGLSFSMDRSLEYVAETGENGLRVVLGSPEVEDDSIIVLARREKEAGQYVANLLEDSNPATADVDGEVAKSEIKTGFEVVQYQVVEGEGIRFVTALAGEEIRYDIALQSSSSQPEDSALYEHYQYIIDNLFIQ